MSNTQYLDFGTYIFNIINHDNCDFYTEKKNLTESMFHIILNLGAQEDLLLTSINYTSKEHV
jgi:hypothetical protein